MVKPCPFCGSEARLHEGEADDYIFYYVECNGEDCDASTSCYDTQEEALDMWNRRAEPKKGKWIAYDDDSRIAGKCSVCGWESHLYEDDVVGMSYCPNCGAEMENGE